MKIAVTGEGPTDYGKKNFETGQWEWGPVAAYIEKIAVNESKEVELYPIDRKDVDKMKLQRRNTAGLKGKGIPARKFAILMQMNKCDRGVYYCDADRESGSSNSSAVAAEKHYKEVLEEVRSGLEPVKAIPMIAFRMIECWLMGDKRALEIVYQIKLSDTDVPGHPEMIWGDKRNPDSNYPKHYLLRIIRNSDKRYCNYECTGEDFYEIAMNSDIEVLRKRCNIGYEIFYRDLTEMIKDT